MHLKVTRREISRELSKMSIQLDGETNIDWEADFESVLNNIDRARQANALNETICLSDSSKSSIEMINEDEFHDAESFTTVESTSVASTSRSRTSSATSNSTTRRKRGRGKVTKKQKNERKREYMREKRKSESYREQEKQRLVINRDHHNQKKIDYIRTSRDEHQFRINEQKNDTLAHQNARSDPIVKASEQKRNTEKRREKRVVDEEYRERERKADRVRRTVANNSYKAIVEKYIKGTQEASDYVCTCCSGLFFRRTVIEFKEESYRRALNSIVNKHQVLQSLKQVEIKTDDKLWICTTCHEYAISRKETPVLSLANNLAFPIVDKAILELNDTEERLVSPRIAFIRIMPLKWDRQKGLRGNVVNVPIDVMTTVKSLPRAMGESETIQVNLMRRMNYNKAYMCDVVRPKFIARAIDVLSNSDLFKKLGIVVDNQFFIDNPRNMDYIVDDRDKNNQSQDGNGYDSLDELDGEKGMNPGLYDGEDDERDGECPVVHETMMVSDLERAGCDVLKIAPGQNSTPISYMHDEYAEEATFLKIFGGELPIKNIDDRVTLQGRCKSFLRSFDRRCSTNIPYIFYMYRQLMTKKLTSAINISLRKSSVRTQITAKDALDQASLVTQLTDNDYTRFMSSIRSAPEFWESKKKQLFAMVRQLDNPTFFITLSPAEIDWPELIIQLHRYFEPDPTKKNVTIAEVEKMSREYKIDLVSRDPVTTARYFENRIRHLLNYMFHKEGPFKSNPIIDYFWKIEFQARGSPHVHMMVWTKDRPKYMVGTPLNSPQCNAIIEIIENNITCESPESTRAMSEEIEKNNDQPEEREEYDLLKKLIKFQIHVHKGNCLVDNWPSRINPYDFADANDHDENEECVSHKFCKYGFPWPILDRTLILDPLIDAKGKVYASGVQDQNEIEIVEDARKNFYKIKVELNKLANEQSKARKNKATLPCISFGDFLDKLDISLEEYILALRASINTPTVFHRRTCHEIMINPYNKSILLKHQANMDIQFVLNSYGVAIYLCSYLMKSAGLMNRLLRVAEAELRSDRNLTLKQKLVKIASKFQNCSEISAQECVYHLLSMPVTFSSREHAFINTFREEDRYSMIKSKKYLCQMEEDATNVYMTSVQEKYVMRPAALQNVCLAEFVAAFNFISNNEMNRRENNHRVPDVPEDEDEVDNDEFENMNLEIELENVEEESLVKDSTIYQLGCNMGYVQRRSRFKIIRFRRFSQEKTPEEYHREQLMLFKPWRNEKKEVQVEKEKVFDEFKEHCVVIAKNRAKFENLVRNETEAEALERMEQEIEEHEDVIFAMQACEQNRIDNVLMGGQEPIDQNIGGEELIEELVDQCERLNERYEEETGFHARNEEPSRNGAHIQALTGGSDQDAKARRRMQNDQYKRFMNRLNRKQHTFMINVLNKVKKNEKFHHLVVGESGTGKSNLIKAVDQCVERHLRKLDNTDPDKDRVILCSYTGKASFNIGGITLHSAFHLPLKASEMKPLSVSTLDQVRKSFSKLRLVIIDEVSMIGSSLFSWVNFRLQQIFDSKELFGGISVILFGDFNQLKPVKDTWIYNERVRYDAYGNLVAGAGASGLWQKFDLYRLTEIMRQADDKEFAQALTTLGKYGLLGLSDREREIFDKRIVDPNKIPDEAIYLYHMNINKDARCEYQLNKKPGELFKNLAKHRAKGEGADQITAKEYVRSQAASLSAEKCAGLDNIVQLKVGIQYMIFKNLDVADGLVNGTTGTLRRIQKYMDTNDNQIRAQFLWFEFDEESVGVKLRVKHADLYKAQGNDNRPIPANWTPFFPSMATYCIRSGLKWSVERTQFPIIVAEALTIDKAQGQTYGCVAFDLNQTSKRGVKTLKKSHLYVALSRVRRIEDLHLFGAQSIVEGIKHQFTDEKVRRKIAEQEAEIDKTNIEMKRMQVESPFINRFPFTDETYRESKKGARISICMQNVANLKAHLSCVQEDFGMMNADVIVLVETATKTCEPSIALPMTARTENNYYGEYKMKNYRLLQMGSSRRDGAKNGCALYIRKSIEQGQLTFIKDNSNKGDGVYDSNKVCELGMFGFRMLGNEYRIIYAYNHPKSKFEDFYHELKAFMVAHELDVEKNKRKNYKVYVIGDINIDIRDLAEQDEDSNARVTLSK